jgi:pantoate--beta-alanine ligase
MQIIHTLANLRMALAQSGQCVFVPTMGNLHEGHLALVRQAARHGLPVVVSIFVNRLQFAPHEDFDRYPRTFERDVEQLRAAGAMFVFAPSEAELYPIAQTFKVVPSGPLVDQLEGQFRPGFFTGVSTVVMKLFQCVQPRVAVFGKKDYQQLKVIEHLVQQFALPVLIEAGDTARAPDGLALSSRNAYLNAAERLQALQLPAALGHLMAQYRVQPKALMAFEAQAIQTLQVQGWQVDYMTVRCKSTLLPPDSHLASMDDCIALGAAKIGQTRLIDNFED